MKLSDVKKTCAICSRLQPDEFVIPANESKLRIFMANNQSVHAKWSECLVRYMSNFTPPSKLYLCSLHFADDSFKKDDGKLKSDAVPLVNIAVVQAKEQADEFILPTPTMDSVANLVSLLEEPVEEVLKNFELPVVNGDFAVNGTNLSIDVDLLTPLESCLEELLEPKQPLVVTEKCVICANFENFDVNNSENEVTYFSFPASHTSQREWKEAITRHKPGLDFDASKAWVCSLHFPQKTMTSGARNGWKHSMAPQVVFHQPRVVTPPPVERPKPKPRTGPECVICLGLQHYYSTTGEAEMNDRPRVFVRFPTNKTMRTQWTKIILTKFPATKIMTPNICTRHFLDTDFDAHGQLLWHATPVIPILPPAPEVPEVKDQDDVSEWMPPDLIEFESVQLTPEYADVCSLNAGVDEAKGLPTCTFLFTKPSVLVRVTGVSAIREGQEDLKIMTEFQKFVAEAEMEYLARLNEFYIQGLSADADPAAQFLNCRFCLTQKDLIPLREPVQSKEAYKTIAEWLMLFCPDIRITPTDNLSQKVCMDCKIEVLYAINLRVRAKESDEALKRMLQDCDNSIEMVPMCRICMDDSDLQPIEALTEDIELITDFEIELDNGLPNYVCEEDEVKIKETADFLRKVRMVDEIQRRVLLGGQGVGTLFPGLPSSPSTTSKEDDLDDSSSEQEGVEVLDSYDEELPDSSPEFGCNKCEARFRSIDALSDHKKTAHYVPVQRQCDICAEIFPDAYRFRLHTLTEHFQGDEIHQCPLCRRMFKHPFLLEDHTKRCRMAQAINKKNPLKVWSCEYCRFKTFLETLYREHVLVHTNRYQCHHCSKFFTIKRKLMSHFTSKNSSCYWQRQEAGYLLRKRKANFVK